MLEIKIPIVLAFGNVELMMSSVFVVAIAKHVGNTRDVSAWMSEAFDEAGPDRVGGRCHDDGDRCGGLLGGGNGRRRLSDDQIRLQGNQLVNQGRQHAVTAARFAKLYDEILALLVP